MTRKITRAVARIALGLDDTLCLGNLDSQRDWGHARDYVRGMYLMLQQDEPDDYVIATGEQHTVREFAERSFRRGRRDAPLRGRGGRGGRRGRRRRSAALERRPRRLRTPTTRSAPSTARAP